MTAFAEIADALPIILSLILIEGLLSVDNALALASMVAELPEARQKLALRLGILGAYAFRALALAGAAWLMHNWWIKLLGGAYLIYLMCAHLSRGKAVQKLSGGKNFWMTILSIELMDLSLSVDNVIAAVALSPKLWVVFTGVALGILTLRLLAGWAVRLVKRFPILNPAAFLLVGYVGCLLLWEMAAGRGFGSLEKFSGLVLILAALFLYGKSPALQRALGPLVRGAARVMRWLAWIVEAPWKILFLRRIR